MQLRPNARMDENRQHISSEVIPDSPVGGEDKGSPFHLLLNVRDLCGCCVFHCLKALIGRQSKCHLFLFKPMPSKFPKAHNFYKQPFVTWWAVCLEDAAESGTSMCHLGKLRQLKCIIFLAYRASGDAWVPINVTESPSTTACKHHQGSLASNYRKLQNVQIMNLGRGICTFLQLVQYI